MRKERKATKGNKSVNRGMTKAHVKEWTVAYEEGKSIKAIANDYQVDYNTVRRAIHSKVIIRSFDYEKLSGEWAIHYKEGKSVKWIAKKYGVANETVESHLGKQGFYMLSPNSQFIKLAPTFKEQYLAGRSTLEIAEEFNISAQTVSKYLSKMCVPIRTYEESSRIYSLDDQYFASITTKEQAFYLGIIFSIGSMIREKLPTYRGIMLNTNKPWVIACIYDRLQIQKPQEKWQIKKDLITERIIHSMLVNQLQAHHLDTNRMPNLSNELLPWFFYGYLYAGNKERAKSLFYTTKSKELQHALTNFLTDTCHLTTVQAKEGVYATVSISQTERDVLKEQVEKVAKEVGVPSLYQAQF